MILENNFPTNLPHAPIQSMPEQYTVKPVLVTMSTKTTFFVSLKNGFSLKHVLKEDVYKNHLSIKTTFCVSLGRSQ